ncbi:hypothetical protein [Tumebacillus avium]|uniref:hypothetical protein n=1 Tax=Tumebacillus avium TaxID=1903704 RepID=UPI0012FDA4E6|nr:hypothetical protein [Tumebacillus avium]
MQQVGFPAEVLEGMQADQKQYLIDQGVVGYVGTEKKEFKFDKDGVLVEQVNNDGGLAPEGTISTSDLSLSITTSNLTMQSDKKRRFTITMNWEWKNAGTVKLTDKLGMAYNSDFDADPYTNGGYTCNHYGKYVWSGNHWWLSDCGGRPSDLSYGGVGWNVDIKMDYYDYGWTSMNIIAKTANTNWDRSTSLLGKYAHNTSPTGALGLNIGPLTLNVNGLTWDEATVPKAIWY